MGCSTWNITDALSSRGPVAEAPHLPGRLRAVLPGMFHLNLAEAFRAGRHALCPSHLNDAAEHCTISYE